LNRQAPKDLDGSRNVYENLAVRNVTKRANLLPVVKVMPDQSDDAKKDSSRSIDVTSETRRDELRLARKIARGPYQMMSMRPVRRDYS
jgi:hypothetical protein